ncbi:MAG: helix-turn-helix domain-containing protein [Candidatus Acidiferrales bacterium]
MKPHSTQSGMREKTASSRQHAPRSAMRAVPNQSAKPSDIAGEATRPISESFSQTSSLRSPNNAAHIAATEGEEHHRKHLLTVHEVADLLQVPVSWVYGRTRKRSLERIPSYRLGKYWRFRQDEVLAWVESLRRGSHAA